MADTMLAALSPEERAIADNILCASPNYRYDLRCLPPIDPPPAPGPAAAAVAAKAMVAWIKSRRFD
jgi:hypothetical protein